MIFLFRASLLLLISISCYADKETIKTTENTLTPNNESPFNVMFGLSPFIGVVGIEYQRNNHAFGIGLPERLSYRYYYNPKKDTMYLGTFLGKYDISDVNETVNGFRYSDVDTALFGVGTGYRWQWPSGWNVNASISLQYTDNEYSNSGSSEKATETLLTIFPGISIGYKF